MNAAFVLMTSALLTGNHPAAASCNTPSCSSHVSSCDSCGPQFGARLRGLFSRGSCNTCAAPAPCAHQCAAPKCAAPVCDPCACGSHRFLDKLKGMFNRSSCGCDTGCSTGCASPGCGSTGGAVMSSPQGCAPAAPGMTPAPAPEAPKKLPAAPGKSVSFDNDQYAPIQQTPALSPINRTQPAIINNQGSLRNPY